MKQTRKTNDPANTSPSANNVASPSANNIASLDAKGVNAPKGAPCAGNTSRTGANAQQSATAETSPANTSRRHTTHTTHTPDPRRHSMNPLRRKNNLDLNIPKNTDARITREHTLRNTIFTRTRILVLALALVAALSITGTLAYLTWTSNQTANRATQAEVKVRIGERTSISSTDVKYDTDGNYANGVGNKVVAFYSEEAPNIQNEKITVSLVPEIEAKDIKDTSGNTVSNAYLSFEENWSSIQNDGSHDYIETSVVRVYLADDWSDNWSQNVDGTFTYKQTLAAGEKTTDLVTGVTLVDTVSSTDYKSVRLSVLAQAIQSTT